MESMCTELVLSNASTWKHDGFGSLAPSTNVLEALCPNQCSGNGKCQKGSCICNKGRYIVL